MLGDQRKEKKKKKNRKHCTTKEIDPNQKRSKE
jgi:hypothetical protein